MSKKKIQSKSKANGALYRLDSKAKYSWSLCQNMYLCDGEKNGFRIALWVK